MKLNTRFNPHHRNFTASLLAICMSLGMLNQGCLEDIVPEREVRERGTFGTELYNIVYDNSVQSRDHSSEAFLSTFRANRDEFIDAVDTTAPTEDLETLNQVFIDIVPLYENMLYPSVLRKIGVVINDIASDPDAVDAVTWVTESPTLFLNPENANPLGLVFTYDDLIGITDELLALLLKNGATGDTPTNQLLKELSIASSEMEDNSDPSRVVRRAVDMLLSTNDAYAPQMSYTPQIVSKLDETGRPVVREEMKDAGGILTDELGYRVLATGETIAPFEMTGTQAGYAIGPEGLTYNGSQVFETFDLQKTPLAYLVREGDAILRDETLDDALRATQTLLGKPELYIDKNGPYTGYQRVSAITQLAAALLTTLDHDSVGPNFQAISQLLENNLDVVAKLVYDLDIILDIVDETPSNFSADNNLIDRLIPEVLDLAKEPGMLEDLFMALDEPIVAEMAPILAELASLKKEFITVPKDGKYEACFQTCESKFDVGTYDRLNCIRACPIEEVLGTTKIDHNAPETLENRSIFQRVTHLMWETSQTPYEVHAERVEVGGNDLSAVGQGLGPLITFDNLAESYLLTITGDLHLVEHLSPTFYNLSKLIGDDGSTIAELLTHLTDAMFDLKLSIDPTTAEVTRLFNMSLISSQTENYRIDLNTADCKSGYKCLESNADTLFAIEAAGLLDAMYPLLKVFAKHKKTYVLARIVSILFEYYPTGNVTYTYADGKPLDLQPSDFRSMEPVLIRALQETDIVADVGAAGDALLDVKLSDGTALAARFEDFVEYLLTPNKEIKKLDGSIVTEDPAGEIIAPLPPAYLYIDALRELSDQLDADETTTEQLKNALKGITRITIKTRKNADGTVEFEKPAGIHIIAEIVKLLNTIFEDKTADGSRKTWINDDAIPAVQDFLSGRLLYAYFQLFNELDARPQGLEKFRRLVLHLMESESEIPTHLTGTGYLAAAMLLNDHHITSLANTLAIPLDPDREWTTGYFDELSFVMTLLVYANVFNEFDKTHSFNKVAERLFETKTRKRSNLQRLLDVGETLLRVEPGSPKRRTSADVKTLLDFAYDLFTDDDRGVERIFGVIDFTIWGNDRRPDDWKPEDASVQIDLNGSSSSSESTDTPAENQNP